MVRLMLEGIEIEQMVANKTDDSGTLIDRIHDRGAVAMIPP